MCLAHVSTGQRWRFLATEASEALRRHCTGCFAAYGRKEKLVLACLDPSCLRCTQPVAIGPDGTTVVVTGKKRGRPSKAKPSEAAAAASGAAASM